MTASSLKRPQSDAFSTFGWGLRRYAWVVAISIAALGFLVPYGLKATTPVRYQAEAQVGPAGELKLQNLDALPRLGETVFRNGAVAESVRSSFDPPLPDTDPVIPDRANLVAPQDNVVFTVTGEGETATEAKFVADVAAGTLTEELNRYDEAVGAFALQRSASVPARPVPSTGAMSAVAVGIVAGALCGMGLIAAFMAWRRPVIDAATAEKATGAPVLATLKFTSSGSVNGMPQLCQHLLRGTWEKVFLTGPPSSRDDRQRLSSHLRTLLTGPRAVTILPGGQSGSKARSGDERSRGQGNALVIIDGPTQVELARRAPGTLTLLVVPVGIRESQLRRLSEHYLDLDAAGIALVRQGSWLGARLPHASLRMGSNHRAEAA
jgi:hypothetical protein